VFTVKRGRPPTQDENRKFCQGDIVSFTETARGEITCGIRKPENDVVINYLPAADVAGEVDGVVKSVQFVPSDVQAEY
jgi:hypothetical protein